jgi:two-component system chemotaxis response regulator CheB
VTAADPPGAPIDVVAIGASAGGVTALQELVAHAPADLRAVLLVVLHLPSYGVSVLADILGRVCDLPVRRAADGLPLELGTVVVAQLDHHLLVERDHVRLSRAARINGHRPAIDPLFESVAAWYGPRAIGVVLSGTLDDGVAGLAAIRREGGVAVVQDPGEATYPGMPRAAIDAGVADHVLTLEKVADLICRASEGGPPQVTPRAVGPAGHNGHTGHHGHTGHTDDSGAGLAHEAGEVGEVGGAGVGGGEGSAGLAAPYPVPLGDLTLARTDHPHEAAPDRRQAALSCPSCGGTLWEGETGGVVQFECRVGHRYSTSSLLEAQGTALEDALWAAHRALLERADLARRLARRMRQGSGAEAAALRYDRMGVENEERAHILQEALDRSGSVPPWPEPT